MGRTTVEIGYRYAAAIPLARRVASDRKPRRHAHEVLGSAKRLHQLLQDRELRAAGRRVRRQRHRRTWLRLLAAAGLIVLAYRLTRRGRTDARQEPGYSPDGAAGTGTDIVAERP